MVSSLADVSNALIHQLHDGRRKFRRLPKKNHLDQFRLEIDVNSYLREDFIEKIPY